MDESLSESLSAELHDRKRKLTRPRQAILDILSRADRHLTPAEVHRRARSRYPGLGLATVYRTLDLLVRLGYAQRVHFEGGCHSYAASIKRHGHHLVCTNCGRAQEFADCDLEPLISSLQVKTGYAIDVHMLELMGRCPDCQKLLRKRR